MVLLSRSLTIREGGSAYEMSGVLPFDCSMVDAKLQSGYRCTKLGGTLLNGHEFRYFGVTSCDSVVSPISTNLAGSSFSNRLRISDNPSILSDSIEKLQVFNVKGIESNTPFYRYKNAIVGTTHWEWGRIGLTKLFEEIGC